MRDYTPKPATAEQIAAAKQAADLRTRAQLIRAQVAWGEKREFLLVTAVGHEKAADTIESIALKSL